MINFHFMPSKMCLFLAHLVSGVGCVIRVYRFLDVAVLSTNEYVWNNACLVMVYLKRFSAAAVMLLYILCILRIPVYMRDY